MWSSELVVTVGDVYLAHLLADIDSARQTIDLESYIVEADEIGSQVTAALPVEQPPETDNTGCPSILKTGGAEGSRPLGDVATMSMATSLLVHMPAASQPPTYQFSRPSMALEPAR